MHTVETDMLAAKLDLLMKRLDKRAAKPQYGTVKAMDSQMTCEVCGNVGHSRRRLPRNPRRRCIPQQRVSSRR
jgi:hypothetical protein